MDAIGWLSSACFMVCALPQVIKCIKMRSATGLSWAFLLLWFFGELFGIVYVLPKGHRPILANYAANAILIIVILVVKVSERIHAESCHKEGG